MSMLWFELYNRAELSIWPEKHSDARCQVCAFTSVQIAPTCHRVRNRICGAGGLHNIIRGVPLVRVGEHGVEWYLQGQGQLGMEGFAVGGMYVLFALCGCGLIFANEIFDNPGAVRVSSYMFIVGALILFMRIKAFYAWKTGYHLRFYLFEVLGKAMM